MPYRTHPLVPYRVLALAQRYEYVVDPSVEVPEIPEHSTEPLPGDDVYWIYAALPIAKGVILEVAKKSAPVLGLNKSWGFELVVGMMHLSIPPHKEYPRFADAFALMYGARRYIYESVELFKQAAQYLPYVEVVDGAVNIEVNLDVGLAAAMLALLQTAKIDVKEVRLPCCRYVLKPANSETYAP